FFQAEDGIRDFHVTGVQTCALPILRSAEGSSPRQSTAVVRDGQGSTRAERARGRTARRRPVGKGARAAQRHSGNVRRAGYEKFRSEERRVGKERSTRWTLGQRHDNR